MFGIQDPWIWSSYFVGIAGVLFCVAYGWLKRNEGDE
ncbi:symporter small accessory protein [Candidatus Methanarcanum hacksteinii]